MQVVIAAERVETSISFLTVQNAGAQILRKRKSVRRKENVASPRTWAMDVATMKTITVAAIGTVSFPTLPNLTIQFLTYIHTFIAADGDCCGKSADKYQFSYCKKCKCSDPKALAKCPGHCGKPNYKGDGYCDVDNNNCGCAFDGTFHATMSCMVA